MRNGGDIELNAAQIAALYALRGTIAKTGKLELDQLERGAIVARHPDGRIWLVEEVGASHKIVERTTQ